MTRMDRIAKNQRQKKVVEGRRYLDHKEDAVGLGNGHGREDDPAPLHRLHTILTGILTTERRNCTKK
jgi:hypothetical protein